MKRMTGLLFAVKKRYPAGQGCSVLQFLYNVFDPGFTRCAFSIHPDFAARMDQGSKIRFLMAYTTSPTVLLVLVFSRMRSR